MKCSNITTKKSCTYWMQWFRIPVPIWQLFYVQNAETRGKKGDSKFYHKTSAVYLFICFSALYTDERDNWVQQKCWPQNWWRDCKAKPSVPQGTACRQSWVGFPWRRRRCLRKSPVNPAQAKCWSWYEKKWTSSLVCYHLYISTTARSEQLHEFHGWAWTRKHYL